MWRAGISNSLGVTGDIQEGASRMDYESKTQNALDLLL